MAPVLDPPGRGSNAAGSRGSGAPGGRPSSPAEQAIAPRAGAKVFEALVDAILPDGEGIVMVLQAYFDESERQGGTFAVAGFAFIPLQAQKFSEEWRRMLGGKKCFHTTDLIALQGEFKDFDREDADRMLRKAVGIINRRASAGFVVFCDREEFQTTAPRTVYGWTDPYPVCAYLCMGSLGKWMRETSRPGDAAYFFEGGGKHTGEAHHLMDLANRSPEVREFYRYRSHAFVGKCDAEPLQAADFLAWEWTKFSDPKEVRPMRRSLRAMLIQAPDRFQIRHLTGASFRKYCEKVHHLAYAPETP